MATNQDVEDVETRHQTFADRQTSGLVNKYTKVTDDASRSLYFGDGAALAGIFSIYNITSRDEAQSLTRSERNMFIRRLSEFYPQWYLLTIDSQAMTPLETDLAEKGFTEAAFQARAQSKLTKQKFAVPSKKKIEAAIFRTTYMGSRYSAFTANYRNRTINLLNELTRQRILDGATVTDILNELRGTPSSQFNYKHNVTRMETHIRTAAKHVESEANQQVYQANKKFISGWRFFNPLDSITSDICENAFINLSNNGTKIWPIGQGPIPPLHFNCRSQQIPVYKRGVLSG